MSQCTPSITIIKNKLKNLKIINIYSPTSTHPIFKIDTTEPIDINQLQYRQWVSSVIKSHEHRKKSINVRIKWH
jgi:hypothetical protein